MRYKQRSARRVHQIRIAEGVLFLVGAVLLIGGPIIWLATPLPTEAARYAWRRWQAPALAIALDRSDARLLMEIGDNYFGAVVLGRTRDRYDPALAARAYRKALAIEPGILWGHYSLARIAFAKGDFKTALAEIDAELAANPENLRSLYVRGLIYGYRALPGDLTLAEIDFTRFVVWTPSEWAGYNDLSWILAKEGKYAEIEALMAGAFAQVPDGRENPWLWNELGVARLNLGEQAGARDAFAHALSFAQKLSLADWRAAYSGDSPASDQSGLAAFIAGIKENLAKASG